MGVYTETTAQPPTVSFACFALQLSVILKERGMRKKTNRKKKASSKTALKKKCFKLVELKFTYKIFIRTKLFSYSEY